MKIAKREAIGSEQATASKPSRIILARAGMLTAGGRRRQIECSAGTCAALSDIAATAEHIASFNPKLLSDVCGVAVDLIEDCISDLRERQAMLRERV